MAGGLKQSVLSFCATDIAAAASGAAGTGSSSAAAASGASGSSKRKAVSGQDSDTEETDVPNYDMNKFRRLKVSPAPALWSQTQPIMFRSIWYEYLDAGSSVVWKHGALVLLSNTFYWVCFACAEKFVYRPPATSNCSKHLWRSK